jgi:hypothetical protein
VLIGDIEVEKQEPIGSNQPGKKLPTRGRKAFDEACARTGAVALPKLAVDSEEKRAIDRCQLNRGVTKVGE